MHSQITSNCKILLQRAFVVLNLSTSVGFAACLAFIALGLFTNAADTEILPEKVNGVGMDEAGPISLKVSAGVWPCFPDHFDRGDRSLSDVFAIEDGMSVEISSDPEFLTEDIWRDKCNEIFSSVDLSLRRPLLNVGTMDKNDREVENVDLEELYSYAVSFIIWSEIMHSLTSSQRYVEAYILTSTIVVSTYRHAAVCALNPAFRDEHPIACDFLTLRKLMATSWNDYNNFIELHGDNLPTEGGMRETLDGEATLAHRKFSLIEPWEF